MRLINHAEPELHDQALSVLRDVVVAHAPRDDRPSTPLAWKGHAVVLNGVVVVEAVRRSNRVRRHIRVTMPWQLGSGEKGHDGTMAGVLHAVIETMSNPDATAARSVDTDHLRDVVAFELADTNGLLDWHHAFVHPGWLQMDPFVLLQMHDGGSLRISPTEDEARFRMSRCLEHLLRQDSGALHLDAFETGNDVVVRIGAPPLLEMSAAPTPLEVLEIGARLAGGSVDRKRN